MYMFFLNFLYIDRGFETIRLTENMNLPSDLHKSTRENKITLSKGQNDLWFSCAVFFSTNYGKLEIKFHRFFFTYESFFVWTIKITLL